MNKFSNIITFDGTAGSGKGTIAKRVAKYYGFEYLDTGKLYRALATIINKENLIDNYKDKILNLSDSISSQLLDSKELYTEKITLLSSKLASDPEIRDSLYKYQRDFVINIKKGAVLDGRDTGSVICPEAKHKFYIDANLHIRAKRRYEQNVQYYRENNISLEQIIDSMDKRDKLDSNRKIAPLIIPEGANIIDNSNLTIDQAVKKAIELIDY